MGYKVTLTKPAAEDFQSLPMDIQKHAIRQLEKLKTSPYLGDPLGHRYRYNLTGFRALHFYKNQYRICYRILEDQREVEVWAIGKREGGYVYRVLATRLLKKGR
ncbi:MAG: type II toxin-antitoxin system RelE/ParE family toxin [Candidatus Bipolaricaulota bacterium]|nr:type II toxin-antitoxin system RelE/ParE family toxin [Candidatus Bipolaricaulota bacterium]